jgi:hypothetical protein
METFMPNVPDAVDVHGAVPGRVRKHDADGAKLFEMCPRTGARAHVAPYHIVNTNVVLVSSYIPKFRARGGDNFVLTPLYCGSNATGWCATGGDGNARSPFESLTFATAMAVSGAALNPNTGAGGEGVTRQPLLSFLMGVLNIRLGYWAPNPSPRAESLHRLKNIDTKRRGGRWGPSLKRGVYRVLTSWLLCGKSGPNALCPGLSELFMRMSLDENSQQIQLSDGGHFENLGLYELIRRRLKLIIVCDGTADKDFAFADLANAVERVRADFGAIVDIDSADLERLVPKAERKGHVETEPASRYAERGYLVADITYSAGPPDANKKGKLIYMTTTFFKELSADLYAYRKCNDAFPDQPTSDQFFDEKQFEAYRELGFQTACRMMCGEDVHRHGVVRDMGEPRIDCRQCGEGAK